MIINIKTIYNKNIGNNYINNNNEFNKDFTSKEKEIWMFTLQLLKDNYPKCIYNDKSDVPYLNGYLNLYLLNENASSFTIEEWFIYLKSKE